MTFQDFMESFFSKWRREFPSEGPLPPDLAPLGDYARVRSLFEEAHLFHLKIDDEEISHLQTIALDLVKDITTVFPCPFDNFALVEEPTEPGGAWILTWILRLGRVASWPNEIFARSGQNHFLIWPCIFEPGEKLDLDTAIRFFYTGDKPVPFRVADDTVLRLTQGSVAEDGAMRGTCKISVLRTIMHVAAISHPANYIVERAPLLSPREARQTSAGRLRPDRKRPHFIVIDHDGLVQLNPVTRHPTGSHASPVPHSRRGHWRRLSERCTAARAAGETKIWVDDTYVGEREFSDEKNRYSVRLGNIKR